MTTQKVKLLTCECGLEIRKDVLVFLEKKNVQEKFCHHCEYINGHISPEDYIYIREKITNEG